MAITFDTNNTVQLTGFGTSQSFSYTCSGTNRLLTIGVWNQYTPSGDAITGATYNGISMTLAGKIASPNTRYRYLFYLLNPDSGSNTVVISASTNTSIVSLTTSYDGVSQIGQPDNFSSNSVSSVTNITSPLTINTDNSWLIGMAVNDSGSLSPDTGTTQRTVLGSSFAMIDSGAGLGTGSNTLSETLIPSGDAAMLLLSMKPFLTPSVTTSMGTITGLSTITL